MLKGVGLEVVYSNLLALQVFTIVLMGLSTWRFRATSELRSVAGFSVAQRQRAVRIYDFRVPHVSRWKKHYGRFELPLLLRLLLLLRFMLLFLEPPLLLLPPMLPRSLPGSALAICRCS